MGGPGWRSRPVKPETTDCCIVWSCDGAYIKLQQRTFKVHSNSTGPPIRLCRRSFWQVVTRQNLPFWLQWLQKQHMSRERDIQEEQPEKKWRIRCCSLLLCLLTFLLFGGKDTESKHALQKHQLIDHESSSVYKPQRSTLFSSKSRATDETIMMNLQFGLKSNSKHTQQSSRPVKRGYKCHKIKPTLTPQYTTLLSQWHRHLKAALDVCSD